MGKYNFKTRISDTIFPGDTYYTITIIDGHFAAVQDLWDGYKSDYKRLEVGNIFKNKEDAEKVIRVLKKALQGVLPAPMKAATDEDSIRDGETYYYIYQSNDGLLICQDHWYTGAATDNGRNKSGNIFKTRADAEAALERIGKILQEG